MKKLFWGIAAALVIAIVPLATLAAEFRFGENPTLNAQERITDDVYLAGGSVQSAGAVEGDLFAGGGTVVISGAVQADLMAGGGNVSILSSVGDDLRVGGGTVVVQGSVGGDAMLGGGQVTLGGEGIGGDLAVGAGSLRIDAPVAGDVYIGGGSVYLNSPIEGNVFIEADTLTLGSGAHLSGNLTYKASKALTAQEGATVAGETNFEERPKPSSAKAWAAIFSILAFGKFLALLSCALLLGLIFKRFSREAVERVVQRPLLELGRGLLVFAALPVISILLFVTIIGIPLGVVGLLSFTGALIVSWIMAPVILGSLLNRYFSGTWDVSWKTILIGTFLYSVMGLIPLLGWLGQTLLLLASLGALTAIKLGLLRQWR